ncbi:helix-turn-helix domain-containing protein [Paenibacillus filicis]|uniref:Helix-turn-helix domain-containing protein n=1 Tax=Paenibacillus filicis TaxID=669464 RepID=A0ABU9DWN8_9BACL
MEPSTCAGFSSHLYKLEEAYTLELPVNGQQIQVPGGGEVALIGLEGAGLLNVGQDAHVLSCGEVWLLPAEQICRMRAERGPVKAGLVRFGTYAETEPNRYERTPGTTEVRMLVPDFASVLRCWEELSAKQDRFLAHAALYRLMGLLDQTGGRVEPEETTEAAVDRVACYMERHLEQELSREELARLAGLSPGYFSAAFQRYKGESPSDYILRLRLERAEELLLLNGGVKETAARVGFEDEFYFSRRFKQKKGLSPTAYIRSRSCRIASVSEPLSGNLLALRLMPQAAALYPHHALYGSMLRLHASEDGQGALWEQNLRMLEQAAPELIFCTDCLPEQARAELVSIAPTVPIGWLGGDWRSQLRQIAQAAGRDAEASAWLDAYDRKAEAAWRQLRGSVGGATVHIWRIMDREFRIYGERNAGAVLYRDLRMASAHGLRKIEVYETVTREELFGYDADLLVIMIDPTPQAAKAWQMLQLTEPWSRLEAVRQGRVYPIGTEKLFEYSAWSHEKALSHLSSLLI